MKRIGFSVLFGFLGAGALVSMVERIVLVHNPRYPAWLATGRIETLGPGSLSQLRMRQCGGSQPIQVFENRQQFVLRCGDWWPVSKTWVVPRTPTNIAILQDPEAF